MLFVLLAMTEYERGRAVGEGLGRLLWVVVGAAFGVFWVVSKLRSRGNSQRPDLDEDPKGSANNDPNRSGRPRF